MRAVLMAPWSAVLVVALVRAQVPPPATAAAGKLRSDVNRAVPGGLDNDPLALLTGLPDYVRYQGWGLVLTLQNIPILEPAYWDRAIASPYTLNRSTQEKMRQFPGALRMTFYNYYLGQFRNFTFQDNRNGAYQSRALENAWSITRLSLDGSDANSLYASVAGGLAGRFSPEELADAVVFGLARPPIKQTEEDWHHLQHVFFYNAALMAAAWFGFQFMQNRALLRGGRWWRLKDFSVGIFSTVRNLGVAFQPNYSGDVRLGIPGVETAFALGGRLSTAKDAEQLAYEHSLRVNWLNYFSHSVGWDVYAQSKLRYTAVHANPLLQGRGGAEAQLSGRRENILDLEGVTLGVDGSASTTVAHDVGLNASMALENLADSFATGMRFSAVALRDKPTQMDWAFFVAAPLGAPLGRPTERDYQMHARLLREQVLLVMRTARRVAYLQQQMALPVQHRAAGATLEALRIAQQVEGEERELLRFRLGNAQDAQEEWQRSLRRKTQAPQGYVTPEEWVAAQAWSR